MSFRHRSLVLAALLAPACANEAPSAVSEAPHTAGEFIWRNEPQLWMTPVGARPAATDPVTTRLQDWLARFDGAVRASLKERGVRELAAPPPVARLKAYDDINAYIAMVPTCVTRGTGDVALLTSPATARLVQSCVESATWTPEDGRAWVNAFGQAQVSPTSLVRLPDATTLQPGRVAIYAALSDVHVYAGAIAALKEKSIAAVLAHELGHYYRAHLTTSVAGQYGFWYERTEALPERPVPAAEQAEYAKQFEQTRPRRQIDPSQTFHPRIVPTLLRWVVRMKPAEGHACHAPQAELAALPERLADTLVDEQAPPPDRTTRAAYLALEPALQRCFEAVNLTDGGDATTGLRGSDLDRAWLTENSGRATFRVDPATFASAKTLDELARAMQARALVVDDEARLFQARLETNHIGVYTTEQEADDLAMDLAVRVGLTPEDVMEGFLELGDAVEARFGTTAFRQQNGMSMAECRSLAAAGFVVNGKEVHVPFGALSDPHHALCYRVFNLHRERTAHRYEVAPPSFPPDAPPWAEVQRLARSTYDSTPAPAPVPDAGTRPPAEDPVAPPPVTSTPSVAEPSSTSSASASRTAGASCAAAPGPAGGSLLALAVAAMAWVRRRAASRARP